MRNTYQQIFTFLEYYVINIIWGSGRPRFFLLKFCLKIFVMTIIYIDEEKYVYIGLF